MLRFEIRNELFGPIPPCNIALHPFTLITGGEKAGMGLLLRAVFFLTHLRSLLQMQWEYEVDDGSDVLHEPKAVQNRLATQAFHALFAGQDFDLLPGAVLRCAGTDVMVGPTLSIRTLGEGVQSLLLPRERLFAGRIANPLARSALGLTMEILHKSHDLLPQRGPHLRVVEQPELVGDPLELRAEVLRLATWVAEGHTVLASTHEPLVLQILNNLLQAALLPNRELPGMPRLGHRLGFAQVMVYHLAPEQKPEQIISHGHIREDVLGRVRTEVEEQRERINLRLSSLLDKARQQSANER